MKKLQKQILASLLAMVLMMNVVLPVQAQETPVTGSHVEVEVEARQWSSTYRTYDSAKEANEHPITIYIDADEFPVNVTINGKYSGSNSYTFADYGTKQVEVEDFGPANMMAIVFIVTAPLAVIVPVRYAAIKIAPESERPSSNTNTSSTQATITAEPQAPTIDDKLKTLLDELDLPFTFTEKTHYAEELRAFLTGEWDGSHRREAIEDGWGGFFAWRAVENRTYLWNGTNRYSGEVEVYSVSVDYLGYKEVIPGITKDQDYSLAVSYRDGIIEEWSLLEMRDSWELDLGTKYITDVKPMGISSGSDVRAIVQVVDADGQDHYYFLNKGGTFQYI